MKKGKDEKGEDKERKGWKEERTKKEKIKRGKYEKRKGWKRRR